jgi:hypothetical protein
LSTLSLLGSPLVSSVKMGSDSDAATKRAVGGELLAVLPRDGIPWYKKGHMLKLHFCVLSLVMFCEFLFSDSYYAVD